MKDKAKPSTVTAADFKSMNARFRKSVEVARALDRKQPIPHSVVLRSISLEGLLSTLTPQRYALLKLAQKHGEQSIAELAEKAGRDRSAVSRDVARLAQLGLLTLEVQTNAGHGLKKVVRPAAQHIHLETSL